jgi:hypothetical protein
VKILRSSFNGDLHNFFSRMRVVCESCRNEFSLNTYTV